MALSSSAPKKLPPHHCSLARQLARSLRGAGGRRRPPGGREHDSSPRSPPGPAVADKESGSLTFCACSVESTLSFHNTGPRSEPRSPFSPAFGATAEPRRGRGGGGGGCLVFTLVTMSTASQKPLLINTESTWCE